jgi:uncharacterized protein
MRLVLDTNVLVSALLTPRGPCARILADIVQGGSTLLLDARILSEWTEVLARPKFRLPPVPVKTLLGYLSSEADWILARPLAPDLLPDPDDLPFLEVAREGSGTLVTGNIRHFPETARKGVRILDPAQALVELTAD